MSPERIEKKKRREITDEWLSREGSVTRASEWIDEQLLLFDSGNSRSAATLVCSAIAYYITTLAFISNVAFAREKTQSPGSIGEFMREEVGLLQQVLQHAIDGDFIELKKWFAEDFKGLKGEVYDEPKKAAVLTKIDELFSLIPDQGEQLDFVIPPPPWLDERFNSEGASQGT